MELCHENNWLWNWKISEKQKTVLIQRNETHTYGLMRLRDSLKKQEVKKEIEILKITRMISSQIGLH